VINVSQLLNKDYGFKTKVRPDKKYLSGLIKGVIYIVKQGIIITVSTQLTDKCGAKLTLL